MTGLGGDIHLLNFIVGGRLNSCRELPTYPRRGIKSQRSSIFFPRDRVVYSVVSVRVHVYSKLERRLGMWLDIFKACEVAGSGAFLTSFDSFDSFLSRISGIGDRLRELPSCCTAKVFRGLR